MKTVSFKEYQDAKNEIIGGVEFKEETQFPNQWGMMSKQYTTESNGTFYETADPNTGITEFWSDKHSNSRYYDGRTKAKIAAEQEVAEQLPAYGEMLAEKIRAEMTDRRELTSFEKFILDRGWEFKTEETLKAGYDRLWKCAHDALLSETEFIIEAGEHYEVETLKAVYAVLVSMVEQKKITAPEVYRYAHYKWCLRKPEAIIAYQKGRDEWAVNDCDTEISEDEAKIAVNSEWGFEVSRVKIIGTPYYDATDYQYIRFDCAHMTWLWKNGNLYQVYA